MARIGMCLVCSSLFFNCKTPQWPQQCWIEREDHLLPSAGNTSPKVAQDSIYLLCGKDPLLAHVGLGRHQDKLLSIGYGVVPPHMQGIITSCWTSWGSCQPIPPASCGPSGWPLLLVFVISNLEEEFVASLRSLMKVLKGTGFSMDSWCTLQLLASSYRPCDTHHCFLGGFQAVFSPPQGLLDQPICEHLAYEDLMGSSLRGLTEVQAGNVHCPSFICQVRHFITQVYQLGQAWLPLDEWMLIIPDDFLVPRVHGKGFPAFTFLRLEMMLTIL